MDFDWKEAGAWVLVGMVIQIALEEAGFEEWLRSLMEGDRIGRESNLTRR